MLLARLCLSVYFRGCCILDYSFWNTTSINQRRYGYGYRPSGNHQFLQDHWSLSKCWSGCWKVLYNPRSGERGPPKNAPGAKKVNQRQTYIKARFGLVTYGLHVPLLQRSCPWTEPPPPPPHLLARQAAADPILGTPAHAPITFPYMVIWAYVCRSQLAGGGL